jgi:hypothetical protein
MNFLYIKLICISENEMIFVCLKIKKRKIESLNTALRLKEMSKLIRLQNHPRVKVKFQEQVEKRPFLIPPTLWGTRRERDHRSCIAYQEASPKNLGSKDWPLTKSILRQNLSLFSPMFKYLFCKLCF